MIEHDFNLLVAAFRQMKSSVQFRKAALKIALNETKWNGWTKIGITEDALAVVRENMAQGIPLFRDSACRNTEKYTWPIATYFCKAE